MPSRPDSTPPVSKAGVFREQAIAAWRRRDEEPPALLNLSPRWMQWGFAGVLALAAAGLFAAANITIDTHVTGPAVVRRSDGDSLVVEALFPARAAGNISVGQSLAFRASPPNVGVVTLEIIFTTPLTGPSSDPVAEPPIAIGPRGETALIVVRAARFPGPRGTGSISFASGTGGTAQLMVGRESLLHHLQPRTFNSRSGP